MNPETNKDYGWENSAATHAHGYLLPSVLAIIDGLHLPKGARVFDAGCGNGFLAGQLSHKDFSVTAVDSSISGIEHAKKAWPRVKFETASVYDDLPALCGRDYDLVVSTEVVEHLTDPRAYANNLLRILKPGGYLLVSTPYHGYMKNLALSLAGKWDDHFTALWDGGHIKFWSYRTLKKLLAETGFSDFRFYGSGRLPLLWKSMIVVCRK